MGMRGPQCRSVRGGKNSVVLLLSAAQPPPVQAESQLQRCPASSNTLCDAVLTVTVTVLTIAVG